MPSSTSCAPIRVYVVTSHLLAAQYLLELLENEKGITAYRFDCVGKLNRGQAVLVFLIDYVGLPLALDQCVSRLHSCNARSRFVLMDEQAMEIERMLQLGIHGFLTHADVEAKLVSTIRTVADGKTWISARSAREFVHKQLVAHNGGFEHKNGLTRRENAIIELVRRRMSNHEIAGLLGIRDSTVKFHVSNIFSKLQIKSRRDLLQKENALNIWNMLLHSSASRDFN
jgi:DNA-binding NarL/FixJ family response regulator